MDATMKILLFVGGTALTVFLFSKLDRKWPGGTATSLVAFVLFALSFFIPDENSAELQGLNGFLRINGIIGIILGVFYYLRHKKKGGATAETAPQPNPQAQTNPNKCPQCGLVNRLVDASCKRCGTKLQRGT